jgi:hypothetical protein
MFVTSVEEEFRRLIRSSVVTIAFTVWTIMMVLAIAFVIWGVVTGRRNNSKLSKSQQYFDQADLVNFNAEGTTTCRTVAGSQLIINDGYPIVVAPFLDAAGLQRHFPDGIDTPCYSSEKNGEFVLKKDATVTSTNGIRVDANTELLNPQGLIISGSTVDCAGTAPCLPADTFCTTEFGADYPYGTIFLYTRTNVGSASATLRHICVCILDWDPVADSTVTLPYCTEPLNA